MKILEWYRKGWSYHCKGLWYLNQNFVSTVVGSANFGFRSIKYDLETQIVMISESEDFKKKIEMELNDLESDCKEVDLKEVTKKARTPPLLYRLILPWIKKLM